MAFSTKTYVTCDGCGAVIDRWTKSEAVLWQEAYRKWGWRKVAGQHLCVHCVKEQSREESKP